MGYYSKQPNSKAHKFRKSKCSIFRDFAHNQFSNMIYKQCIVLKRMFCLMDYLVKRKKKKFRLMSGSIRHFPKFKANLMHYTALPQHTPLGHNIHHLATTYTTRPQHTPLGHNIHHSATTYTTRPQYTSLGHNIHHGICICYFKLYNPLDVI